MKKTFLSVISLFLIFDITISAQETFTHKASGIDITLPAGWFYEIEGENMTAYTEDETLGVNFTVLKAADIDAALTEVDYMLDTEFDNVEIGEAEDIDVNGMYCVWVDGYADGVELLFAVIQTPKNKSNLLVMAWGLPEVIDKYAADIRLIITSIEPSK